MSQVIPATEPIVKKSSALDQNTITGLIVIAVVCCVVGTSLVWVVIIYQTRRRQNRNSNANDTEETTAPLNATKTSSTHKIGDSLSNSSGSSQTKTDSFLGEFELCIWEVVANEYRVNAAGMSWFFNPTISTVAAWMSLCFSNWSTPPSNLHLPSLRWTVLSFLLVNLNWNILSIKSAFQTFLIHPSALLWDLFSTPSTGCFIWL